MTPDEEAAIMRAVKNQVLEYIKRDLLASGVKIPTAEEMKAERKAELEKELDAILGPLPKPKPKLVVDNTKEEG